MIIVGIDEVGRGCWAGPLVAGAVALDTEIPGLRDSKKLSKQRREALDTEIRDKALGFGLGWVSPEEIDEQGLTKAVRLAMLRAVKQLHATCETYDRIVIDGNHNFFLNVQGLRVTDISAVIKADDTEPAVSAASIIAKVAHDKYMATIAAEYPEYKFEVNVGYGTVAHRTALQSYGVTILHRKSYKPVRLAL